MSAGSHRYPVLPVPYPTNQARWQMYDGVPLPPPGSIGTMKKDMRGDFRPGTEVVVFDTTIECGGAVQVCVHTLSNFIAEFSQLDLRTREELRTLYFTRPRHMFVTIGARGEVFDAIEFAGRHVRQIYENPDINIPRTTAPIDGPTVTKRNFLQLILDSWRDPSG